MLIPFYSAFGLLASCLSLVGASELRQLTSHTFQSSIDKGVWLVEHYSPQCHHCQEFMPTWEKLVQEKKSLESITGFHMAQVNCLAQGDLCATNNIKFYPSIRLYQDGKELDPYTSSRSHDTLSEYIDRISNKYAKREPLRSTADEASAKTTTAVAAAGAGEVFKIEDEAALARVKEHGGFVKFFAPWCGHCKKLAPTWVDLAKSMSGKLTIAEVDCEAHKALCRAEGVMSYPQLYLFANGQKYEHSGGRSLGAMETFAKKALSSGDLEYVNVDNIDDIAKREEVFFVYLHTFASTDQDLSTVMKASRSLLGSAVVFQSRDPELFHRSGVDPLSGPVLLSFKDHTSFPALSALPFTTEPGSLSIETVASFLQENKLPTVVHLDSDNFKDVMKNDRGSTVVLVGLRTEGRKEGELERETERLRQVATAWRKGGRKFENGVIFAWMDGDRWGKWLKQMYGMSRSKLPQVVVATPDRSEYYDLTLDLEPLIFTGASIFSTLEGVHQNTLRPRTIESVQNRLFRAMGVKLVAWNSTASDHPWLTALVLLAIALGGCLAIRSCVRWDFPVLEKEKLSTRLD